MKYTPRSRHHPILIVYDKSFLLIEVHIFIIQLPNIVQSDIHYVFHCILNDPKL